MKQVHFLWFKFKKQDFLNTKALFFQKLPLHRSNRFTHKHALLIILLDPNGSTGANNLNDSNIAWKNTIQLFSAKHLSFWWITSSSTSSFWKPFFQFHQMFHRFCNYPNSVVKANFSVLNLSLLLNSVTATRMPFYFRTMYCIEQKCADSISTLCRKNNLIILSWSPKM